MTIESSSSLHAGYVAILGRPNVGKSTLLNRLLGFKLSSTSRRPQTTRHRIHGIKTTTECQTIFIDTPGLHKGRGGSELFRTLNRTAAAALADVDVVIMVCEGLKWTEEDEAVLLRLQNCQLPVILVINKVDRLKNKEQLLPHIEQLMAKYSFQEVLATAAAHGNNVETLQALIQQYLPVVESFPYAKEQKTLESHRFYAAEMVREKVMRQLGDELPYTTTVEIEQFDISEKMVSVTAVIWVERQGQKGIVIGKQGSRLKLIGSQARLDMEKRFQHKVYLKLWVKVRAGWGDDQRALRSFGYID